MIHILHVLLTGWLHIHGTRQLMGFYLHHGAVKFLLSGITSESPATPQQALALLHWLVANHISPGDW